MLVTPQEILDSQHYDADETAFVTVLILAAEAFLVNADAFREQNPLTPAVVHLIVGFWLDNRDSNYSEYVKIGDFPLGMQSLITQLKYSPEDVVPVG